MKKQLMILAIAGCFVGATGCAGGYVATQPAEVVLYPTGCPRSGLHLDRRRLGDGAEVPMSGMKAAGEDQEQAIPGKEEAGSPAPADTGGTGDIGDDISSRRFLMTAPEFWPYLFIDRPGEQFSHPIVVGAPGSVLIACDQNKLKLLELLVAVRKQVK